ncbi:MAG: zinc finger domain-containing protein, partial [Candidatus Acidiferrales bacterium]
DSERSANWDRLLGVREEVLKALEPMRAQKTISANLEARVILTASGSIATLLQRYAASLPAFFIVSQVEVEAVPANGGSSTAGATGPGTLTIRAERALGSKCERCWNYSTHVGESADYPTFCERCVAALNEIEAGGGVLTGSPKS